MARRRPWPPWRPHRRGPDRHDPARAAPDVHVDPGPAGPGRGRAALRDDAARVEQVKLLAQKGEIENALRIQREQAEQQLNAERPSGPRSRNGPSDMPSTASSPAFWPRSHWCPAAPSSSPSSGGTSSPWKPRADSFAVRTPTFQSVSDFVAAQLAQPHYAHFIRSTNQGGTAGTTAPTRPTRRRRPIPRHRRCPRLWARLSSFTCKVIKGNANTDPRLDLSSPMGLRRTAGEVDSTQSK